MALTNRGLVDAQLMEGPQIHPPAGPFDIMFQDPPQSLGMYGLQFRDRGDRHFPTQRQDQQLEEQRKSAARPRPGHVDILGPAFPTANPRDRAWIQVSFWKKLRCR